MVPTPPRPISVHVGRWQRSADRGVLSGSRHNAAQLPSSPRRRVRRHTRRRRCTRRGRRHLLGVAVHHLARGPWLRGRDRIRGTVRRTLRRKTHPGRHPCYPGHRPGTGLIAASWLTRVGFSSFSSPGFSADDRLNAADGTTRHPLASMNYPAPAVLWPDDVGHHR